MVLHLGKVVIDAFRLTDPRMQALGQEPRQTTSNLGHLQKPSIQVSVSKGRGGSSPPSISLPLSSTCLRAEMHGEGVEVGMLRGWRWGRFGVGAVRVEMGTVRGGGEDGSGWERFGWRWGRFGVEVRTVRGGSGSGGGGDGSGWGRFGVGVVRGGGGDGSGWR